MPIDTVNLEQMSDESLQRRWKLWKSRYEDARAKMENQTTQFGKLQYGQLAVSVWYQYEAMGEEWMRRHPHKPQEDIPF
jgi:hypothetical protein